MRLYIKIYMDKIEKKEQEEIINTIYYIINNKLNNK